MLVVMSLPWGQAGVVASRLSWASLARLTSVPDRAARKHDETHEFALPENTGLGKDMLEMSFRGIQCDAKCIRDILKRFPTSDLKRDTQFRGRQAIQPGKGLALELRGLRSVLDKGIRALCKALSASQHLRSFEDEAAHPA